jgi:hypothetical protein
LCELLQTGRRDEVLVAAIEAIRGIKTAKKEQASPMTGRKPAPVQQTPDPARESGIPPVELVAPIGLTLEEFLRYGP